MEGGTGTDEELLLADSRSFSAEDASLLCTPRSVLPTEKEEGRMCMQSFWIYMGQERSFGKQELTKQKM